MCLACLAAANDSTSQQAACSAAAAEQLQASDGTDECPECITCWEGGADVVLQPCGHLCVCSDACVELLRGAMCPMCRSEVLTKLTAEGVLYIPCALAGACSHSFIRTAAV